MKFHQSILSAVLLGAAVQGAVVGEQNKAKRVLQQHGRQERMLAPEVIDEDGEKIRRVWVHYYPGRHDSGLRRIQNASDDKRHKLQFKYDFPKTNSVVITATEAEIKELENDSSVKAVVDDPIRVPLASSLRKRRNLLSWNGQASSYGVDLVQSREAWEKGLTGEDVTVCVIDTGFDLTHEDFASTTYTGDSLDANSLWSTDGNGHGTHVTGIISMADNDKGLVGVAPQANIHTVKVFDDFGSFVYSSALVEAAYQCRDAGAKVISMSLGGDFELDEERAIFTDLYEDGILSIAAAGNYGDNSHSYPASYSHVISVGAVDRTKNLATFSQYNNKVDLVAPGVDVWSALPMGFDCQICAEKTTDYGYASLDGTSQATPHVAGVAALLWSYNTTAPVQHIYNALLASAEDLGSLNRDDFYGQGLVQAASAFDVLNSTLNGAPLEDWSFIEPTSSTTNPTTNIPDCTEDEILVTVDLKTDRYGNETAWEVVRNTDGFTVMAGAGFGNREQTQSSQCLPDNCYTFTVADSFGDGLCCEFGNGSLDVTVDGEQLLTASNFTDSESVSFGGNCVALSNEPKPELPPCVDVTLTLLTDTYPTETAISLEDLDTGAVSWSNEIFSDSSTTYTLTECIDPTGCHKFEITDAASDGICCAYGSGSFELSYDGELVFSGGAFGASEVHFLGDSCANQQSW